MYSIRDSKSEIFNAPFYKSTHGEAERDFTKLVNDDKSMLSQFPEDFDLYYLGVYDDNTGKIMARDTPEHVTKAALVKRSSTTLQSV